MKSDYFFHLLREQKCVLVSVVIQQRRWAGFVGDLVPYEITRNTVKNLHKTNTTILNHKQYSILPVYIYMFINSVLTA